jgi:hypothetical protein
MTAHEGIADMLVSLIHFRFDPVQTVLPDRDLSGCRYVRLIQLGDPAFSRMAIDRLKSSLASA